MASVSISRLKPVLTVLILMIAWHTDSTTSNNTTESSPNITEFMTTSSNSNNESPTNSTSSLKSSNGQPVTINYYIPYESSCVARNWSAAETDCINKKATIFTLLDLATTIGGKVLLKARDEHTTIWIGNNGTTCNTSVNESFLPANCSDTNYYVCKGNTSTSPDWYVPCREGSTDTSTQGSSGSTALNWSTTTQGSSGSTALNFATTTQGSNSKGTVIASATCVIVALVAVFILSGICIIKRNKKPIKYAVRAESAMYHKQHPDPAQVEEPKLADVQMVVSSTEAGIGNGGIDGRPDGEYDILCGVMGREGKAATSDTTTVYSHLRGNIAADDSKEENHYDTATLPQYDRRPVDKIYDRLHVPDQ